MPVTIFEGPDGAGKTTLTEVMLRMINRQGNYVAAPSNHGPYIGKPDVATIYLNDLMLATGARRWHVLMDRAWLSEQVYGPIMRKENRINVAMRRCLERVALSTQTVMILCLPSFESCRKAFMTRKNIEYLPDEHYLKKVYDCFEGVWNEAHHSSVPIVGYSYDDDDPGRTHFLDMVEAVRPKKNEGPGVGAWNPGRVTLLVGEQVNRETMNAPLPFVSWHPGGCVAWLNQQLEEWDIREDSLYWINAMGLNNRPTDATYWLDKLDPKRIIAMGDEAELWCKQRGLVYSRVSHPQFWKRFNHHKPYELRNLL